MARVVLQRLSKRFGEVQAIRDIDLEVEEGEFFSILGPSGCGKTTTLRLIAGFEIPDTGRILFDDTDITDWPPQKRNIGMVFQNYALFPHMTVGENVAFGLEARGMGREETLQRVRRALEMVGLAGLEERPAPQLSGGQQQRVALARALVIEPKILLLDEPLSNLDARLRLETREQLRELQRKLGITTFYVTHDQEEALTQSDRLAIFFDGECAQIGAPYEVYTRPASERVMAFLGQANFLSATVKERHADGVSVQICEAWSMRLPALDREIGKVLRMGFRPHEVLLAAEAGEEAPESRVVDVVYNGASEEIRLQVGEVRFRAVRPVRAGQRRLKLGDRVPFAIPAKAISLFDPQTGRRMDWLGRAPEG